MKRVLLAFVATTTLLLIYRLLNVWPGADDDNFLMARYGDLTLLYAIMPGYFIAMSQLIQNSTYRAYVSVRELLPAGAAAMPDKLVSIPVLLVGGGIGLLYGAVDMSIDTDGTLQMLVLEWSLRLAMAWVGAAILERGADQLF